MSDTRKLREDINACRNALLAARSQAQERAEIGQKNVERARSVSLELENEIAKRVVFKECLDHITSIYKNIEAYASQRKELSMRMLNEAIREAGEIVPDANVEGIQLSIKDKHVSISNALGQDINLREGSAYRVVMGMLLRYTLLKTQPDAIQAIFLDEAFNTLSDDTINAMRDYFEIFKEDMLIVGIEQHDTIFQGLSTERVRVCKSTDGYTIVTQEKVS